MVHFAIYGQLEDADAPFCVRGWAAVAGTRAQLVSELYAVTLDDARTRIPAGYVRRDPLAAERRELPRLVEIWSPPEPEAANG
jgi:hypothetical protein